MVTGAGCLHLRPFAVSRAEERLRIRVNIGARCREGVRRLLVPRENIGAWWDFDNEPQHVRLWLRRWIENAGECRHLLVGRTPAGRLMLADSRLCSGAGSGQGRAVILF